MPTPRPVIRFLRLAAAALRAMLVAAAVAGACRSSPAQRVILATRTPVQTASAVDAGTVPSSTPIALTLTLTTSPEHKAALDEFLANVTTPASPGYHQWLTPQQFATRFGANDDQIAAVTTWLTSQGLTVDAVSPARTRMSISGTASAVESAFAVNLHHYRVGDDAYFANTTTASLPSAIAPLIASVSGFDDLAPAAAVAGTASTGATVRFTAATQTPATDPLPTIAAAIDANITPIITITTAACSTDFAQADYDAYRALFRQANAQGITVLATSGCTSTTSFPASLAEITALVTPGSTPTSNGPGIATRPDWQNAHGLPDGLTRVEPDLTATPPALAQTLSAIVQQSGVRQGNINATLYTLASQPDLFTQPDAAAAGTWESSTGLGLVDLPRLAKAWPRGVTSSMTSLSSSVYAVTYGQPFTLAAIEQSSSSGSNAVPTGTITFSASAQGPLGTSTLTSGNATLPLHGTLPAGTYTIAATYSGDSLYASSSSPPSALVTISPATATIVAGISPSTIGGSATTTLTVTVTLPYPGAAPTGNVTATVNGVPGAVYTSVLTTVPNTASASTTISIPAPINPGTYTVQITCAGSANFECPTPGLVSLVSTGNGNSGIPGNTSTALKVSPLTPAVGQPATLTATITSTSTGNPTGSVTFYNSGNPIATAQVSNNQATVVVMLQGGTAQVLTATYSGDPSFNASTSPGLLVNIVGLASSMNLTESGTSALRGATVLFTAHITSTLAPTGIVTFFDTYNGEAAPIGTAPLGASGATMSIAQISTAALLAGAHQIYAVYLGDANSSAVTSSNLAITVADYTVTASPQTITLIGGQTGIVTLTVAAIGSFHGSISSTCLAPAGTQTSCSIGPGPPSSAGTMTMNMTITTAAANARMTPASFFANAASGATLAMLICFGMPRRRKRLPSLFLAALTLGIAAGFMLGCAGSTISPVNTSSQGTVIFSIDTAGTDGVTTITHDFQYPVTLK